MDLRCSVLGHDFEGTERSRNRTTRDDDVIVVREYRECRRCGERELVSENTRVPARADGGDADGDDEDVEVLQGEVPDSDQRRRAAAERETDDDIIEAPSEEPAPEAPEGVDLSDFDAGRMDPEDADPSDIIEAEDAPESEPPDGREPPSPPEESRGEPAYVCPACGLTERPAETSLRPGDICPRCREDYLERREG